MNKRICAVLFMSLLLVFAFSTVAAADTGYVSSQNIYINVAPDLSTPDTGIDLAATTFDTQEGAHATLNSLTGQKVDHAYIVVCVGNQCAWIDPPVAIN